MKIHVYVICWNEEVIIPHFLKHYAHAERIYLFDNESDDRTRGIAASHPNTEVIPFSTGGEFNDAQHLAIKNTAWKRSRGAADWVIVCDADELVYHPALTDYLQEARTRGISIFMPRGFNIVTERQPRPEEAVLDICRLGSRDSYMDKCVLFDPNAIDEINYTPGAHDCAPTGRVKMETATELILLHLKYLGEDYVLRRHHQYGRRLSAINRERGWGAEYLSDREATLANYLEVQKFAAFNVLSGNGIKREDIGAAFLRAARVPLQSPHSINYAIGLYEQILVARQDHAPSLNNMSVALFLLGRHKSAKECSDKLLRSFPEKHRRPVQPQPNAAAGGGVERGRAVLWQAGPRVNRQQ